MIQQNVGNLIYGFSGFSKSSLNIWKFTVHALLKSGFENFEHYFANVWDEQSQEEPKSLLKKVKEESEKVGLMLNIQKIKIMASGPITSWQTDGETMETVTDFILGGSKITADGYCSHEIKRRLLLGRKVTANQDSILKSRDITLPTKFHLVKAMVCQWSCLDVKVGL